LGNNLFGPEDPDTVNKAFERWDTASVALVALCTLVGIASLSCFGAGALKVAKAFAFVGLLRLP